MKVKEVHSIERAYADWWTTNRLVPLASIVTAAPQPRPRPSERDRIPRRTSRRCHALSAAPGCPLNARKASVAIDFGKPAGGPRQLLVRLHGIVRKGRHRTQQSVTKTPIVTKTVHENRHENPQPTSSAPRRNGRPKSLKSQTNAERARRYRGAEKSANSPCRSPETKRIPP